jgi:dipeptide/tripeptide permease
MQHNGHTGHRDQRHYLRLVGMIVLSFISMYVLMYSMANSFADVYNSLNQVYMAGLMTAPMVVIELWLMSSMYKDKKLNAVVIVVSIAAGVLFWTLIRQQTLISDRQFLRSMIPHHSGAILMCEDASLQDQRIKELCKEIIASQRREIDQMRALLEEPPGRGPASRAQSLR